MVKFLPQRDVGCSSTKTKCYPIFCQITHENQSYACFTCSTVFLNFIQYNVENIKVTESVKAER